MHAVRPHGSGAARSLRLRDVLARLDERDGVLPPKPMQLRVPLVLVSGFSPVQTSLAVRSIRALGVMGQAAPQQSGFRWPWDEAPAAAESAPAAKKPMFAAAVPKALDKPLSVLCEELEGDHLANSG